MRVHYTKLSPKSAGDFATAAESVLYFLLEEEELITFKAWWERLSIYCQHKPQDTRGLRTDLKATTDNIKLLVSKGYVKEILGESVERLVNLS